MSDTPKYVDIGSIPESARKSRQSIYAEAHRTGQAAVLSSVNVHSVRSNAYGYASRNNLKAHVRVASDGNVYVWFENK